jgi:hypothetical protein
MLGRGLVTSVSDGHRTIVVGNFYLPPQKVQRALWWEKLVAAEGATEEVALTCDVLCGDFNLITDMIDSGIGREVVPEDIAIMDGLSSLFGHDDIPMIDGWRTFYPASLEYTHFNTARTADKAEGWGKSRIDRIYIRQDWYTSCRDWLITSGPSTISDHAWTMTTVLPSQGEGGLGRWRAPGLLIANHVVLGACRKIVERCFEGINLAPLRGRGARTRQINRILEAWRLSKEGFANAIKTYQKEQAKQVRSRLHTLRVKAQAGGGSREQREVELKALEESEHREFTFSEFYELYESNELLSTYYHANVRSGNGGKTRISGLKNQAGELKTDPEDMLRAVEEFYAALYNEKPSDPVQRERMLKGIQKQIDANHRQLIGNLASDKEVRLGLRKGNKGRSPGSDGLPIELYANMFGGLENDHRAYLRAVIQAMEDSVELPDWLTEGCLTLLYKQEDPSEIKNYRPLTVMGADYKLYTGIQCQRLNWALQDVIGEHQYAQLPGRLIGDNIKLIQSIIEGSKSDDEGLALVFLDQVKAYDRVSYDYLWEVLERFGLPPSFIRRAKAVHLNSTVVPWINGVKGRPIRVYSGVRQGDPLSCALFLMCIEPLALALASAPGLSGVRLPDGSKVTSALYSDDATGIVRNNEELEVFSEILHGFQGASGSLTNWSKSLLYILKDWPDRALPEACKEMKARTEGGYKHLGIIVGIEAEKDIADSWTKLLAKMESDAVRLGKLRVSQRTRCRLATTFIMSQCRHMMNFQTMTAKHLEKMQKIQHTLIMGDKASYLTKERTYLNRAQGGLGLHNPAVIRQAQAVAWVARMDCWPELPWVQLTIPLLQRTATRTLIRHKALKPWRQELNSKVQTVTHAPSLSHIWDEWRKVLKISESTEYGVKFRDPQTPREVQGIYFWYYPGIFTGGRLQVRGVATWGTAAWTRLASGEFGDIDYIGDIFDCENFMAREFGDSPRDKRLFNRAINTFLEGMPAAWTEMLYSERAATLEQTSPWARNREEWRPCVVPNIVGAREWTELSRLKYKESYQVLSLGSSTRIDNSDRIKEPRESISWLLKRIVDHDEIWLGVTSRKGRVPKCNDLLFRLLHDRVLTGGRLEWLETAKQRCPLCDVDQTIEHIWVDCPVAKTVWARFEVILKRLDPNSPCTEGPRTSGEFIGLLAVGPDFPRLPIQKTRQARWMMLYSEAVWRIWKDYLDASFGREVFTPERSLGLYNTNILHRIMMDRARIFNPRMANRKTRSTARFKEFWGQTPKRVLSGEKPLCLR